MKALFSQATQSGMPHLRRLVFGWLITAAIVTSGQVSADVLQQFCRQSEAVSDRLTPIASRGAADVYSEEIAAFLNTIPADHARYFVQSDHLINRLQQQSIERLIAMDALENGLAENPEIVGRAVAVVSSLLAAEQRKMQTEILNRDALVKRARELYLSNPEQFSGQTRYTFRHLLVSKEERSEVRAAERMLEIRKELSEGAPFSDLVARYSDDSAQPDNGYSSISLSDWPEEFRQVFQNVEPSGQVLGPFSTANGWHFVQYQAQAPAGQLDWEADQEQIIEIVRRQESGAIERRYIRQVSSEPLEINESAIENLRREVLD